jgi:hypothetical protein
MSNAMHAFHIRGKKTWSALPGRACTSLHLLHLHLHLTSYICIHISYNCIHIYI